MLEHLTPGTVILSQSLLYGDTVHMLDDDGQWLECGNGRPASHEELTEYFESGEVESWRVIFAR